MRRQLVFVAALMLAMGPSPRLWAGPPVGSPGNQTVTLRITCQSWNEYRPWIKEQPGSTLAAGTVLPGKRILVLARYLENATLIQVEKWDRPPRFPARVLHVDPQLDLAVVSVDSPGFFDDLKPVTLMRECGAGGDVTIVSWNDGRLEVANSRFSRVVAQEGRMGQTSYLAYHFITDLSSGGYGESVFKGKRLFGVMQYHDQTRATVIPAELVRAYLDALKKKPYGSRPQLGVWWQQNRCRAQSEHLGLAGEPRGVFIRRAVPGGSAFGCLQAGDVLLELDGHGISSEGEYRHPVHGMLDFNLIVSDGHAAGDAVSATVLRARRECEVRIPLRNKPTATSLIPWRRASRPPPYLIAGGLVFRELDAEYLRSWGEDWRARIPTRLRVYEGMESESQTPDRRRLLVLSAVLPDAYNLGYHGLAQLIVERVNGLQVDSIAELNEAFGKPQGAFHVIRFVPNFSRNEIVLDAAEFEQATERIMKKYSIPGRIRVAVEPAPPL
ncbi:MAG: hypothetical protein JXR37_15470 [Kiritimatiellae bacterium]|nr:hypothetical protein [Kiritimatiellia bacterium]